MLEHVETMFTNMAGMMKGLKKASYETRMEEFRNRNDPWFKEMTEYVRASDDKESAAREIAESFVNAVESRFSKNGRIKARTQVDLNFFMIYYVFPALLLTKDENADMIADRIRHAWAARFKDSNIQYADYDRIYEGFREKIFGIF